MAKCRNIGLVPYSTTQYSYLNSDLEHSKHLRKKYLIFGQCLAVHWKWYCAKYKECNSRVNIAAVSFEMKDRFIVIRGHVSSF